ncbi:MAG: hypothetical protein LBN93_04005 [Candidatus Symbiothrix sp.]|jgi:hypothetical protein|nr:hypothetical protein [Candidatus Symbiothrix sp.]
MVTQCIYELDVPFKHLKEGLLKFVWRSLKDLSDGNYALVKERLNTHLRKRRDPYYFAMWRIDDVHRRLKKPYILLVSAKQVPYLNYLHAMEKIIRIPETTPLVTDTTFIANPKITPEDALREIKQIIDTCKKSDKEYISLWHSSNLAGSPEENPWINVYLESMQYAISLEND